MTDQQINRYAFSANDLSIDLRKLLLLKVLLETESLSKSAAYLGMAVSSASRDLSDLRNLFDDQLFIRSGNRMVPTNKMKGIEGNLDHIFSNVGDMFDLKRNHEYREDDFFTGTVRVAANDNTFSVFIGTILPNIVKVSRGFKTEIYPASMGTPEALRKGLVDFLIAQDPFFQVDQNFHVKQLLTSPHVAVMRRGHPLLERLRAQPERTLSLIEPFAHVQTPIAMPSGFSGVPPVQRYQQSTVIQTPYFTSSLFLAANSDTIVISPRVLIHAVASQLHLEYVEIPGADPWCPMIYWHERTHESPLHQRFRGLVELGVRELERIDHD